MRLAATVGQVCAEAARMLRDSDSVEMRVLGAEHPGS
jgi:hypothetical protein